MQPSSQREEPLSRLIAVARKAVKQLVWSRVSSRGMTPQQFWTMLALRRLGVCSLHDLALRVAFDDPTASRVVATLVRRRLVSVSSHPDDRRRSRLCLSAAGAALLQELEPVEREVHDRVEGVLTAAERATLTSLLRRVTCSVESSSAMTPPVGRSRRRTARG